MKKIWFDEAWEEYLYWQTRDKKTIKRINALIKDIERANFDGFWSRRIDDSNRLIYRINDGILEILSCKGHYED